MNWITAGAAVVVLITGLFLWREYRRQRDLEALVDATMRHPAYRQRKLQCQCGNYYVRPAETWVDQSAQWAHRWDHCQPADEAL